MVFTLNMLPEKVFLPKRFLDKESAIAPGLSCLMVGLHLLLHCI